MDRLVIFDCDGVLVDSEVLATTVLSRALDGVGVALSPEECLARYSGLSMASIVTTLEAETGKPLPPDFLANMRAADAVAFERELKPIPGVREILEHLALPRCVASSGTLSKMRLTLSITRLLPFFEPHLFSAEQVAHGKPAPDLFLLAAEQMGARPEACVVIEDSRAGVQAGCAAGMRVVGFSGGSHCRPGHAQRLKQAGARVVIETMAELPALLANPLFFATDRG